MPLVRVAVQFFDAHGDPPDGRWRHSRECRFVLILILLAGWVVVLPLAGANLPDPLWVGGVYDAGDYDSLIAFSSDAQWLGKPFLVQPPPLLVASLVSPTNPIVKSSGLGSVLKTRPPPST
jgi:hypothetical protein